MRKNWKILLPIFFIVFLDMLSLGIVIPVLTPIFFDAKQSIFPAELSTSTRSIIYGFLNAIFPLTQFFGAPILGALSDKYGRKKTLLASLIGTMFGHLLFGVGIITRNLPLLFISRAVDGFTAGNISIATSAVADISTQKAKSKNFTFIGVAYALGIILGPYLGGKLSDSGSIHWFSNATPFWFATAFSLISAMLVYSFFRETLHTKTNSSISILTSCKLIYKAFKIKNLKVIFLVVFLITLGFNFFTMFFQVFLYEKFRFNDNQVGTLLAYSGLWVVFGLGVVNNLALRKYHPQKILITSISILSIALLLLSMPNNPYHLYMIVPFIGIFYSLTQPNILAIISNLSSEETQGEVLGINQAIQALATAIPPIISGFIISKSINSPIILASLSVCFAGLIYMRLFNQKLIYRKNEKFSLNNENEAKDKL